MSVSSAPSLMGVSEADREGIERAALDYAEGWYIMQMRSRMSAVYTRI
jgi:hypothetical protein